jgi:hypothetical protein
MLFVSLAALALAAPSAGVMVGAGLANGPQAGGGSYASAGPLFAGTLDWRFGPVETFIGASASGLVAPEGDGVAPIALLQGEFGFGFGNPMLSGGFYFGAGLSGGEGGLYGRVTVPTAEAGRAAWARRIGGELRIFRLGESNASVLAVLVRAELGNERSRRGHAPPMETPPPPPPPVHHDDPYGD